MLKRLQFLLLILIIKNSVQIITVWIGKKYIYKVGYRTVICSNQIVIEYKSNTFKNFLLMPRIENEPFFVEKKMFACGITLGND